MIKSKICGNKILINNLIIKFENFKAELIFERGVLRPILDLAISVDLKGQLESRPLYPFSVSVDLNVQIEFQP